MNRVIITMRQQERKELRDFFMEVVRGFAMGPEHFPAEELNRTLDRTINKIFRIQDDAEDNVVRLRESILRRDSQYILWAHMDDFAERMDTLLSSVDQAIKDYQDNRKEIALLQRIKELEAIEDDPARKEEYETGMRQAMRQAKTLLDPTLKAERDERLRVSIRAAFERAIFYAETNREDMANMPLRRDGLTAEERTNKFECWFGRHYS